MEPHSQAQQRQRSQRGNTIATQTSTTTNNRRPNSRQNSRNLALGSKDLIIRMLAEVFQVNQTDTGQVKWQQVSSSLVPVSLYSRTTSKWLSYLLSAPTKANATTSSSCMSPDSRDFLQLLLQQFHHQQAINKTNLQQTIEQQRQNQVVFQVVAHDYLDGQCKKILSVKLVQPGTRLGQASDYFVYWKEQSNSHLQSSISNNSLSRLQKSDLHNEQLPPNQFVATCCGQSFINQQILPMTEPQTWGLNFASINDAKLFFDICSLNLVDLDFNSEYLRQLTLSLAPQNRNNNLAVCQNSLPQAICGQQSEQKLIMDFLNYKQRQQQNHSAAQTSNPKLIQQQNSCQFSRNALKKQLSQSKCPSCKQLVKLNELQRLYKTNEGLTSVSNHNNQCPVHARQRSGDLITRKQVSTGASSQVRSRSSTRQTVTKLDGESRIHSLKRLRSFSTPATPDHMQNNVQSETECELHRHEQGQMAELHHPRCLSYMRQQKLRADSGMQLKKKSMEPERPKKPVRGVLRESSLSNQRTSSTRQSSVESSQVLHSKRATRTRYVSQQSNQERSNNKESIDQQLFSSQTNSHGHQCDDDGRSQLQLTPEISQNQPMQGDQQDSVRFSSSKSAQRRYTGVDSAEVSHFDSLSHHSASLARAQYANSKNMKEFLSLDAGGVSPNPGQLASINKRFEEQMKSQNYRRQDRNTKKLVEQTEMLTDEPNNQTNDYSNREGPGDQRITSGNERSNNVTDSFVVPGVDCFGTPCHVSTTTDDLPLDPLTKHRMYKLTSEEVISERTEPKSLLSTVWDPNQQETLQHYEDSDKNRQIRAISLGLELDDESRSRDKRSDTGRRRSLERSMCVDLDPAQTISSGFRQTYRLSPLPQSASPLVPGGENSFENSPYHGCQPLQQLISVHQEPLADQKSMDTSENVANRQPKIASTPKRTRTKSSSSYRSTTEGLKQQKDYTNRPNIPQSRPSCFGRTNNKRLRDDTTQPEIPVGMMSFKSAPDVTYNDDDVKENISYDYKTTKRENNNYNEQGHLKLTTSNVANHSSYAVPLCSRVRSSQYGRPFHSCPNSLRRIKRYPHHHCHGKQQLVEALLSYDNCNRQAHQTRATKTDCSYCLCERRSANTGSPSQCDIYDEANLATMRNKSSVQQQRGQHRCQHQYSHHHHHTQSVCMNNVSREQALKREPEYFSSNRGDCLHAAVQYRPCSSLQSCRSPLRYGLYESDCDEYPGEEDPQASAGEGCDGRELTTCNAEFPSACCVAKSPHPCNEALTRSASSFYFRPLDAGTTVPFKPVTGYDQTMARSTLKSRQRAKSQPPRECSETIADPFHLNKSMETVQKLIKEVQNELNALKRCPLESFGSQGSGVANSKLRYNSEFSSIQPDDLVHHTGGQNASIQMSNEEKNLGTGNPGIDNLSKIPGSSTTRGAGQFKNVGAIRKAGFLSVKKWIIKRRQSIELARKQGWKKYWVCLRGTALLFHSVVDKSDIEVDNEQTYTTNLLTWIQANCTSQPSLVASILKEFADFNNPEAGMDPNNVLTTDQLAQCYIEREPRHLIMIEGAIAQPIPEHPKRDFVFCLSTIFGDAYLFQSSCQLESENWILSVHNACAASVARDLTRDEAMKLFETKIRHLELEAEKKLLLRQRLESRLALMSSLSHVNSITNQSNTSFHHPKHELDKSSMDDQSNKKVTMRALLCRLNQQLLALDVHIEKVHCEIYQLRCYLTSCGNQSLFYRSGIAENKTRASNSLSPSLLSLDLPHPRSLLQFVSKPTKLLLIKLGVFTVSSFHAFVHARQGSLDATLQKGHPDIQGQFTHNSVKLRLRSQSTSESMDKIQNVELENATEKLLDLANLRIVPVKLMRKLFEQICGTDCNIAENLDVILTADSDGIYSVSDRGEFILIEMKIHSSSSSLSIIKQVLRIVNPDLRSFEMLNYYLRLNLSSDAKSINESSNSDGRRNSCTQYEVKRGETLNDWSNYECLELMEKMIFRAELTRSRLDEDSAPFGISIGAQLFADDNESLLNVYCSYIEWGSVADKSGLKDDDELLMINGVPVMDLDLMFVECIIQDESKLRLVIRSSRNECASNAILLDKFNWSSPDRGPDGDDDESHHHEERRHVNPKVQLLGTNIHSSSQIISDEYISSLVCPPPPTKSNAFLRTDSTLLRQKSDLTAESTMNGTKTKINKEYPTERDCDQTTKNPNGKNSSELVAKIMSRSQIDLFDLEDVIEYRKSSETKHVEEILPASDSLDISPAQFDHVLGGNSTANSPCPESHELDNSRQLQKADDLGNSIKKSSLNYIERLRRSILELFETEYAYIKHLETISQHYMSPLEDVSYLDIPNLKELDRTTKDLLAFQRGFLSKLICRTLDTGGDMVHLKLVTSNFEQLSGFIHQLDSYRKLNDYDDLLNAIAKTFIDESENFKIYAAYCANYSGLQRILHPTNQLPTLSHSVFGNPLDTFITSNIIQSGTSNSVMNNTQQYRMPFTNTFMPKISNNVNNESDLKLKQINQFLSHLDSSSSSASLSLAKSSSDSEQTLSGSTNKSKLFRQTGQQASRVQHKSVHQQNFESYLIKPIQRIVKYPILLKSIASSAQSTAEDEPHKGLQGAMKQMESITSHVNDTQRLHDEYGIMFEQIERQYCTDGQKFDQLSKINLPPNLYLSHKPQINLNIEHLLYFGPVDWLNINEYTSKLKKGIYLTQVLFVFNTCVVFICKELILKSAKSIKLPMSNTCHNSNPNNSSGAETGSVAIAKASQKSNTDFSEVIRYQSVIPVSEVQVRSVPVSSQSTSVKSSILLPSDGLSYKWELFRCSSVNSNSSLLTKSNKKNATGKVYLLANESNDARNAFLRKIRFIIRESVRNMSLPLARSPSSKSLTPKKLSSPSSSGGTHTNDSSCSHSTSLSPVRTDRDNATQTQDCVQCDYVDGRVDSTNYTTSIEVNN